VVTYLNYGLILHFFFIIIIVVVLIIVIIIIMIIGHHYHFLLAITLVFALGVCQLQLPRGVTSFGAFL